MTDSNKAVEKSLFVLGLFLIGLGLVVNELTLSLKSADGELSSSTTSLIRGFQLVVLSVGALFVGLRKHPKALAFNLALILTIGALAGEGGIRIALDRDLPFFGSYYLYFEPDSQNEPWILSRNRRLRLTGARDKPKTNSRFSYHARLGWEITRTAENPKGLKFHPVRASTSALQIPFYGDSYVEGHTEAHETIPALLDERLEQAQVLNYGVSGYGIDQIYLRFAATHEDHDGPAVLVGIFFDDLDRSLLSHRGRPKAYFELVGDQLELKGVPIPRNDDEWLRRYRIHEPPSYLYAFVENQLFRRAQITLFSGTTYRKDDRMRLGRSLVDAFLTEAGRTNKQVIFVLFYKSFEIVHEQWRERFFLDLFKARQARVVDTKPLFVSGVGAGASLGDFFLPDGHYNARGNALVAEAIASELSVLLP